MTGREGVNTYLMTPKSPPPPPSLRQPNIVSTFFICLRIYSNQVVVYDMVYEAVVHEYNGNHI
jgi:hypothetical protein